MAGFHALALVFGVLVLHAACKGDDVGKDGTTVGGPCAFSNECDEDDGSFCLSDESFPQGTCGKRCATQEQCPAGSACVNKNSGVCLLSCSGGGDCRENYACQSLENQDGTGQSSVCMALPNP
ncbi:MAG TPA: hypothetical protein VFB62_00485 [Polyangiaceae bacterium]|jgi:hypothetical protein|nr:hypothetical protein [Polyangiaceae bacterium]